MTSGRSLWKPRTGKARLRRLHRRKPPSTSGGARCRPRCRCLRPTRAAICGYLRCVSTCVIDAVHRLLRHAGWLCLGMKIWPVVLGNASSVRSVDAARAPRAAVSSACGRPRGTAWKGPGTADLCVTLCVPLCVHRGHSPWSRLLPSLTLGCVPLYYCGTPAPLLLFLPCGTCPHCPVRLGERLPRMLSDWMEVAGLVAAVNICESQMCGEGRSRFFSFVSCLNRAGHVCHSFPVAR